MNQNKRFKIIFSFLFLISLLMITPSKAFAVTESDYKELITYDDSVSYQDVTNSYRTYLNSSNDEHTYQYYDATVNIDTGYFIDLSEYESVIVYSRNNGIGGHGGTQYTTMSLEFQTVSGEVLTAQNGNTEINGGTTLIYDTSAMTGMAHIVGSGLRKYYYCGSAHCNSVGWVYPQIRVLALGYQSPHIISNLTDVVMTEGIDDVVGPVTAIFPEGESKYEWQYLDGEAWKKIVDGKSEYVTENHGKLVISDNSFKDEFSKSPTIRIKDPVPSMTGLKFRVKLLASDNSESIVSDEALLTVNSRDVVSFYSARLASRYGQVGEVISTDDVISYAKFNNGEIVEIDKLKESDPKRVGYYGFVEPKEVDGMSRNDIIAGLNNGSISYTELGGDLAYLKIKNGENNFYLKFSYRGTQNKNIFDCISFYGKDEMPPVFDENVELYESDGQTLYTRGEYRISSESVSDNLKICGEIRDSVSDNNKISWAYTLKGTSDIKNEVTIPVYRPGNQIEINVNKNGLYTVYAQDESGNTAEKTILVKAFDENDPYIEVEVNGSSNGIDENYYSSYTITVNGSDAERLNSRPYIIKYFASLKEAEDYNLQSASDSEYSKSNTVNALNEGYYLVGVRDAVQKSAKQIVKIPEEGKCFDNKKPQMEVSPVEVKDAVSEISEYIIKALDDTKVNSLRIYDDQGKVVLEEVHVHGKNCISNHCEAEYHFVPKSVGTFCIEVSDSAGNKAELKVSATERVITDVEVIGINDSMAVNSEISLNELINGNRIILKMSDGTVDIYGDKIGVEAALYDASGSKIDKVKIGYGENDFALKVTINKGTDKEKTYTYDKKIVGEDNVAPLPGKMETKLTEGWDGSLTNNISNQMTLKASEYEDDGSSSDKLVITWYKDGEKIQEKKVSEGGDTYGPFSGEASNGTYKYTVTDEKGNVSFSTSEKYVDVWDTTSPTGEVKLFPEGATADSKNRYKQIQIVNASDERGLAEKPFSFKGDKEEEYTIISSIVAGENGSYEIYIRDSAGNVTHLEDVNLTGIDSVAPTINGYEIKDTEDGKKILHIDATDTDSDGSDKTDTLKYSIDGDNYQSDPDFEINESGNYTIYVKDETGNITKTSTEYTDTEKPSLSLSQDESGRGVIIVQVSDNVGLSRVVMECGDGSREILQVYDGATEDTIRKDIGKTGSYKVTAVDMAGNIADESITITSIAAACQSSILTGLKVTPSGWTSGDVTVIAQLADTEGLSASPFRWNGSIPSANPYVLMVDNGVAMVEICDRYGNTIASSTAEITNIDRTSPIMQELRQSEDKNHLLINVSDIGSGIGQITISGGPYSVETGAATLDGELNPEEIRLTLPTNGTYTVRAYDRAGNSCQRQISVEGVTTDIAKVEYRDRIVTVDGGTSSGNGSNSSGGHTEYITQTVEKAVPILVPVPTTEVVTEYKNLREKGEDVSKLLRGDDYYERDVWDNYSENENETANSLTSVETELKENEISNQENKEIAVVGEIDPNLKNTHPFKYWFKKNAEKIAIVACILNAILLILCISLAAMLFSDYVKEERDKNLISKLKKDADKNK